jgi:hypothetical protein
MISTNMSTRLFAPVSPAEPMIIGTPSLRDAISMSSRSCVCQARGLVDVPDPSGIGPTSSLPESAAMQSGRAATPRWEAFLARRREPEVPVRADDAQRFHGRRS